MAAATDPRLEEALAFVASRLDLAVERVEPLEGGLTNASWRLGVRGGTDLVLRLSGGREAELGIDRDSEQAALAAAAGAGLGPRLVLAQPSAGVLVTGLAPGRPWSAAEAKLPGNLRRIGTWLAALHALPAPVGLRRLSMRDALADLSLALARLERDSLPDALFEAAACHSDRLDEAGPEAFCHNDVHHLNVVDDGERIVVVDWEYAGLGEAVVDLAEFATTHLLDAAEAGILAGAYAAGGGRIAMAALESARWLTAFRALLWIEVRIATDAAATIMLGARREALLAALQGA